MALKLTCSVCKFSLSPSPEEEAAYLNQRPMHCAQPMVKDGEKAAVEEPKEEKKGFFGLGKSKKKK